MVKKIVQAAKSRLDLITGFLFFVLGITIYVLSYSHAQGPSDWSLSPGFFPRLSAGFIMALSLLHIFVNLKSDNQNTPVNTNPELTDKKAKIIVLLTMAVILAYPYTMEYFGFLMSSFLSIAILMRLYGMKKWITIILVSLSIPIAVNFLAFKFMYILFPSGLIIEKIF